MAHQFRRAGKRGSRILIGGEKIKTGGQGLLRRRLGFSVWYKAAPLAVEERRKSAIRLAAAAAAQASRRANPGGAAGRGAVLAGRPLEEERNWQRLLSEGAPPPSAFSYSEATLFGQAAEAAIRVVDPGAWPSEEKTSERR